jgi:3-hydroxybutyryl-CoA dehydratase
MEPSMNDYVDLSSLHVGDAVELAFAVSDADMKTFRRISGDDNPVHDDPAFAAKCSFPKPIVYGALTVAQVSRLLGTKLPGHGCVWQSLTMKFLDPLFVGETACVIGTVLHVNTDLKVVVVGLSVRAGNRRIAEGQAQALLRGTNERSS